MNLPNKISLIRILLVPVFMILTYINPVYGLIVFIIAALSDALDGFIARKYNLITDLGKFLDPIADKLLVTSALCILLEFGRIGAWVTVIIICREFIITGLRLVAAGKNQVLAASNLGKIKTFVQMLAVGFAIVNISPIYLILMYAAVVLTIVSAIEYIYKNRNVLKG